MSRSLKELILGVKVDDKASKPLKNIGDAADDAKDELQDLNQGLKKLDTASAEATETVAKLRKEIAATGDLELVKDLAKQEQRLRSFAKQRKLLLGDQPKLKLPPLPDPEPEVRKWGVRFAAKLGPVLVQALPSALTAGGGVGAAVGAPIVAGTVAWLGTAGVGAILGGAAAGAVAGGIAIASRSGQVAAASNSLVESIASQLDSAAVPFAKATLGGISIVRAGVLDLDSEMREIFGRSATYVDPLARGLMGFADEISDGFGDATRAAAPVIHVFKNEFPELGRDISQTLSGLSEHAPAAAQALGMVLDVAGEGIKLAGQSLEIAATAFKFGDLLAAGMKGPAELGKVAAEYQNAAAAAESETDDWGASLWDLSGKASSAADEVKSLAEAVSDIVDKNLSLAEANLAMADAIDETVDAIDKKRGVTHGEQKALVGLAKSLNDVTVALDESGVTAQKAAREYDLNRSVLIQQAMAAGYTREQAKALADQWLKVPKSHHTKATADTAAASRAADRLRNKIDQIDRYIPITATFKLINNKDVAMALRLGRLSAGGPVTGPGPKGVDSQPYLLAPGEYVLSAKDVDKLGGSARIDAWREDLHGSSRPAAVAGSGMGGGGGGSASVRVSAAPGPMQEVVRMLLPYFRIEVANSYSGSAQRAIGTGGR